MPMVLYRELFAVCLANQCIGTVHTPYHPIDGVRVNEVGSFQWECYLLGSKGMEGSEVGVSRS